MPPVPDVGHHTLRDFSSQPEYAIRVWKEVYTRGAATGAVSYYRHANQNSWKHLIIAGTMNLAIVPFTKAFMLPTNNALLAAARGSAFELG
ncbi:uncharacterized protein CTRU02_211333 [Colletotrichum truncatum]|uniref:Uncharacterized protein n=1 Tax=Colletotrichum truncatum TaxID=5467 RepID=A0ACC3YRI3_COLTU|nr:uncharacterized protein CTRU02_02110 [Colletotrichum truncatum]KAF6799239.1 hypothetical protein CTRU02_02110 [Colletotrichum truncatum]